MTQLAFEGHKTRGREVIKLLEMLGGKERTLGMFNGDAEISWYYIDEEGYINFKESILFQGETNVFTLEEFLEKYPFKVGDFVHIPEYESEVRICKMIWNSLCNYVEYKVYRNDDPEWYSAEELLEYNADFLVDREYGIVAVETSDNTFRGPLDKKETIEGKITSFKIVEGYCVDEVEIEFNSSKFEMVKRDNRWFVVKKKPNYPKNYEECCKVFGLNYCLSLGWNSYDVYSRTINCLPTQIEDIAKKLESLSKLIICRDAYWTIAGKEMGLKEPWKPDWTDNYQKKCTINFYQGEINLTKGSNVHFVLAFPTEEMRDAFYENFKDLIETCKELL